MSRFAIFLTVLVVLGACAKRPDAIVPVNIPMASYSNMGCQKLARELVDEQETLGALSKSQNKAATTDAVGVFLVGIPAGSLTGGDKEGQIAVSKGKVQAIESAMRQRGC